MRFPLPQAMRHRRPLQQLAAMLQPQRATSPLGVALLAAIALHLLALSALQLRHRHQPAAAAPPPRDDTPELLRFSRQQTREPAITPLAISALAQLPPPPPPPVTGGRQAVATSPAAEQAARGRDLGRRPRGRGSRSGVTATAPGRPASSRPAADPARLDPGVQAALVALTRWQASGEGRAAIASPAGWPAPQKPEAEQLALWTRLWETATPTAAGAALPAGLELRRLAAAESDAAPLPEGRRLSLTLGDRLLMIWWTGEELRLLQAPAGRMETEGDGQGA